MKDTTGLKIIIIARRGFGNVGLAVSDDPEFALQCAGFTEDKAANNGDWHHTSGLTARYVSQTSMAECIQRAGLLNAAKEIKAVTLFFTATPFGVFAWVGWLISPSLQAA